MQYFRGAAANQVFQHRKALAVGPVSYDRQLPIIRVPLFEFGLAQIGY